jgi:uncharacterized YigZ family protein
MYFLKTQMPPKRLHGLWHIPFFETQNRSFTLPMSAVFSFRTLQAPAEGIYKEKGSKFLAFAYPVETEADIKILLDTLRKQYFDARHHCFAYILGADKPRFRAFDDGEPNHSAGDPILGQIRSRELTNVLVVVIRYFGGVKLGVGGLMAAYKAAAESALNNGAILSREVMKRVSLNYPYASTPEVMRLVKDFELHIEDQSFTDECVLKAAYKLRNEVALLDKIRLLQATGHATKIVFIPP